MMRDACSDPLGYAQDALSLWKEKRAGITTIKDSPAMKTCDRKIAMLERRIAELSFKERAAASRPNSMKIVKNTSAPGDSE